MEGLNLHDHYVELAEKINQSRNPDLPLDYIFDVPEKLAELLSVKATIGVELKKAYDLRDYKELEQISKVVLPEIIIKVKTLRNAHHNQWLTMHKPFGC